MLARWTEYGKDCLGFFGSFVQMLRDSKAAWANEQESGPASLYRYSLRVVVSSDVLRAGVHAYQYQEVGLQDP